MVARQGRSAGKSLADRPIADEEISDAASCHLENISRLSQRARGEYPSLMRQKKLRLQYSVAHGNEAEIQRRIDAAFSILFEATLRRYGMGKRYPPTEALADSRAETRNGTLEV